jgi:hypothetical protein
MLSPLIVRLRALVFRRAVDSELNEEMRYHLDRETERNIAAGMEAAAGRDAARRAMGNFSVNIEQARDAWRWRWLEEPRQDLAFGARGYRRAPLFVITVVATIGLGLGLLSAAFTLFDTYVLRPLPVRDPFALVTCLIASYLPARRAARANLVEALRADS